MSTPRTKRPFAGASADPAQRQITSFFNPKSPSDSLNSDPSKPILPSSVEANLLSVGMRVRKSVPEGYKTSGTSAFKLWTDTTPLPVSSAAPKGIKASSRELLPFCGINKVGGLDTQPEFEYDDGEMDAVPELTMSQESAESVGSGSEVSRKRVFDDEEEGGENDYGVLVAEDFADGRVLAVPQSRMHKSLNGNGLGRGYVGADNDFEDANFLVSE